MRNARGSSARPLGRSFAWMKIMNILITGASGVIGRILAKALAANHTLALVDLRTPKETVDEEFQQITTQHSFVKMDISDKYNFMDFVNRSNPDIIIHLAAVLGRQTAWEKILHSNIAGTITVFETSLDERVDRIIYASTNNVYGGYEEEAIKLGNPLHLQDAPPMLSEDTPPRPDSRYAIAKLMIEEYATYLSSRFELSTIGLRIGTVREVDNPELQKEEMDLIPRFKATWLYHQDLIQLVQLCLKTERKSGIYNAISGYPGTPGVFIDISKAITELGYSPKGGLDDR
jgi:uronate dehydrogenase